MKKMLALASCCILVVGMFANTSVYAESQIEQSKLDSIDDYIRREMNVGKIPGLSLGIVHGNEIVYLKGYGQAGPDGAPVSPRTPFILGSISKTFTALAIRQLNNEKKLDYDEPVKTYLPWFATANSEESDKITIKNLLDHTSGFSTKSGEGVYTGYKYSMEQLVRMLDKVALDRPVGSSGEYSNLNYLVLGLIVQTVSGMSYEDYIQKNIFDLLEMKNSFTSEDEALKNGLATGYRIVYGMEVPTHIPYPKGNISHGFLISSAEDMSKFLMCYLNNGYYLDKSVIPDNELVINEHPDKPYLEGEQYYLTYWDKGQDDIGYYGHSGATVNFTSTFSVSQQSRYGIVILTNSSNDFYSPAVTPDTVIQGVISILEGRGAPSMEQIGISPSGTAEIALSLTILLLLILRIYWIRFFTAGVKAGGAKRTIKLISMAVIDLLFPVTIVAVIYLVFDCTMAYALSAIPEQALPIFVFTAVLCIVGLVKLILLCRIGREKKT